MGSAPKKLFSIVIVLVVGLMLIVAVGSAVTNQPLLLSVIPSGSMYPTLKVGDIVLITWLNRETPVRPGDIVIFHTPTGAYASKKWIMHRVKEGNPVTGFTTKGDGNEYTDQEFNVNPRIKREWIVSRAITIGGQPVKIPLLGYLPMSVEGLPKNPFLLPGIAVILAVIIAFSEIKGGAYKKRSQRMDKQLLYFFSGITLALILGVSMIATSQRFSFEYEVSVRDKGVIQDSPVGILPLGGTVTRPLSELANNGFFPIAASIVTNDPQVTFSHNRLTLGPGQNVNVNMTVKARAVGKHKTKIWVGMFLPLLPSGLIHYLADKSFWLALVVTSLVPATPFMLMPVLEPRLRRGTARELRRLMRRVNVFFS